jgi:diguanylate cyclase (GGDEF)-like protein
MNVHRLSKSLVSRLILAGIAVVLLGTALRYVLLAEFLRKDLELIVSAQQLAIANYVATDIDTKIEQRKTLIAGMAASLPPELLNDPDRLRAWIQSRHELLPLFSGGIIALNLEGVTIADYPVMPGRTGTDFSNHPDFKAVREGESAVAQPIIGPNSKRPVLPFASPIKDSAGTVRGVLVGGVSLSAPGFLDTLQNSAIGKGGGLLLISPKDRLFVAASTPPMTLKPTPAEGANLLHDRAMAGYRGTGITINAEGVEELSAIVTVPSTGWFLVARIPTAEAFALVDRAKSYVLKHSLLIVCLMSLIVLLITWWGLKPLFDAARQADRMTLDEAPLTPLKIVHDDEVGHLTAAFNRLLTKLLNSQDELLRIAHHDSLTGLPNRRLLVERLTQALARTKRNGTRVALLFMDLDDFKPINDTFGHEAGDEALRIIAGRLAEGIRQGDTLARVAGDEFVLIVTDLDSETVDITAMVASIATKAIAIAGQPMPIQGTEISVQMSIGIAVCDGASNPTELMSAADSAMYRAKQAGGGRYVMGETLKETG